MQMSFEVLFTAIGVLLKRRIGNRRMDATRSVGGYLYFRLYHLHGEY